MKRHDRTTIHQVEGLSYSGGKMKEDLLTVQITKDEYGMTMSINNEDTMLSIPLESIASRLREMLRTEA